MSNEFLDEQKKKLSTLTDEEKKQRDLYLKKLADGTIQGPPTGYPSIDKPWLKYYEDEWITADPPHMSAYDYLFHKNADRMDKNALYYYGTKITFRQLQQKIV